MHDLAVDREPSTATFLFADIASFTALTQAHGDEAAVRVVADFCDTVERELPAFDATHVKTIGDALMLRVPDPAQAVLLGLRIALDLVRGHRCASGPRRAPPRAGDRARRRPLRSRRQPRGARLGGRLPGARCC